MRVYRIIWPNPPNLSITNPPEQERELRLEESAQSQSGQLQPGAPAGLGSEGRLASQLFIHL